MTEYIPRLLSCKIREAHDHFKVLVITGPRQSGKTCLCRNLYPNYTYVNLENISDRAAAMSDPTSYLEALGESAIIDEVQNVPELLSMIQVRIDENPSLRYILTGSSNFSLLESISQSLAGRAAMFNLLPFSLQEIHTATESKNTDELLWMGNYPGVIANGIPPFIFYQNYYNTYVERDLRSYLKLKNIVNFDTFMRLLASRVGSEFNASAIAREVGVSSNTISEWLSILTTSYIAFPLRPYYINIGKRFTKMPKIYFYDTGLLSYLLGIEKPEQLGNHILRGAIFENYAIGELLKRRLNQGKDACLYFYRDSSGCEADALISTAAGIELYEIKSSKTLRPDFMANMKYLKSKIERVLSTTVIYDGIDIRPIAMNLRAL